MDAKTISKILKLNRDFYEGNARGFSEKRQFPWPGWNDIIEFFKQKGSFSVLDAGCGNGRFYKFLSDNLDIDFEYLGIDSSQNLVNECEEKFTKASFLCADLLTDELEETRMFDYVVILGVLHHIPTVGLRKKLISKLTGKVGAEGFFIVTLWIKGESAMKLKSEAGFAKNEGLLPWDSDLATSRFVHFFEQVETDEVVKFVTKKGFELVKDFDADGKDKKSNKYLVFKKLS